MIFIYSIYMFILSISLLRLLNLKVNHLLKHEQFNNRLTEIVYCNNRLKELSS